MRCEIFAIDKVTRVRKGHSRQFCIRIWSTNSVGRFELLQVQCTHEISRYGRLLVMAGGILAEIFYMSSSLTLRITSPQIS